MFDWIISQYCRQRTFSNTDKINDKNNIHNKNVNKV